MPPANGSAWAQAARERVVDIARCLRFYSRLPVPALPWERDPHRAPDFDALARMLPIAGALIGAVGACILMAALAAGFGPWLSAAIAIASLTLVTGAFHEDGLADAMDGFGGGQTPERRLEIMRDSRIGSFGGAALMLAFILRVAALATLAERLEPVAAAAALVVIGALSRIAALSLMASLPPARLVGSSYAVGTPSAATHRAAWVLAGGIALLIAVAANLPLPGIALAFIAAGGIARLMTHLSRRLIGGQTGDVAGATQQFAEIAGLIGLLIAVRP